CRAADEELDRTAKRSCCERGSQRNGDTPKNAAAPVLSREDDADAERFEEFDTVQFIGAPRAVKERGLRSARSQCRRERDERREPAAAGNHPRLGGRSIGSKGRPSGPSTGSRVPGSTRDSSVVPAPMRLLKIETAVARPLALRRISKIEKGRRSNGSC